MRLARVLKFLVVVGVLALAFTLALLYVTNSNTPTYIPMQQVWSWRAVGSEIESSILEKTTDREPKSTDRVPKNTYRGPIATDPRTVLSGSNEEPAGGTQQRVSTTNFSVIARLGIDKGQSWPEGSFCDEFLSHKFKDNLSPCKGTDSSQVECYGSPFDDKMGVCKFTNLGVDMPKYYATMHGRRDSIIGSNTIWLVREHAGINPCPQTDYNKMERHMEGGDYIKKMAKAAILAIPQGECQEWVEGVTFFYMGFDVHIYFKFLSWYSLHNGISNLESTGILPSTIIRIPETDNEFLFPEFEKDLFPEAHVYSLKELSEKKGIVCFRKAIVVPWAFSSTPFRCKMADSAYRLRRKCLNCNSQGLPGTRFQSFRRRVLNACSLKDPPQPDKTIKNIIVQLRKPYHRFNGDHPSKFSRVMKNSKEFLAALHENFPSANIIPVYPEDLSICDQVRLAHDADIFIGVHGAGLVHLWWMQEKALLFELVPRSQLANPTFKMLSALTGRRYYGYSRIGGGEKEVIVNIDQAITELKKAIL